MWFDGNLLIVNKRKTRMRNIQRLCFLSIGFDFIKMKNILIITLAFILSSCSSFYVEPPISENDSILKIEVEHPFKFNAPFGMIIEAELDGKLIHSYKYPGLIARVSPGKHTLSVSINAYFYNRAKHHFTEKYEIDFKPNETYTISSKVDSKELKSIKDNVVADLHIKGEKVGISDTFTLEDSAMRSMVCEIPDCKAPIILFL